MPSPDWPKRVRLLQPALAKYNELAPDLRSELRRHLSHIADDPVTSTGEYRIVQRQPPPLLLYACLVGLWGIFYAVEPTAAGGFEILVGDFYYLLDDLMPNP